MKLFYLDKILLLMLSICILPLIFACSPVLQHTPSHKLNNFSVQKSARIFVADIGDNRWNTLSNKIGSGFSFWLPAHFSAKKDSGKSLPISYYIAESLCKDLHKVGYNSSLMNNNKTLSPCTYEDAIESAKKEGADYLVTTSIFEGKTKFWGFIIIPFFQPVWTRIGYDYKLIAMDKEETILENKIYRKDTEWYFAKIAILDSIFDAAIFGSHWCKTAWGKTVVSDALAETTKILSSEIQLNLKE